MLRRILSIVLVALLVLSALALSAQGDAKYAPASKVSLNFWHSYSGDRARLFERLVKEFMQENPKIEVKLTYGGDLFTMRDKLMTAIGGGAGPDIAEIDAYWTPIFAETSALYDLAPYMASTKYNQSDLMEAAFQSTQYKGKTWSIPFNLSNIILYYNKKLFKEAGLDPEVPPATWDQVAAFGKKLTLDRNNDGVPEQWGLTFPLKANFGAVWYWLAFFFQQDGKLFNADQSAAAFNSDAGVAATDLWRKLVWDDKIVSLSSGFNDFKVGNAAMELSSTSVLGGYRDAMGNANIGIAPLPTGKVPATVSGGGNLAILKGCKDPKAAWVFLNWFGSTEVNRRWSLATGALPIRKSVLQSKEYQDFLSGDPKGDILIKGLDFTYIRPNIPQYGDASRFIALAVEESVYGNKSPKPLLDRAKKETDQLFK